MRTRTFTTIFLGVSILSFGNYCYAQENNYYPVEGTIEEFDNDTIQIMYYPLSDPDVMQSDTIVTQGNTFTYKLPVNEPSVMAIVPQKSWFKRNDGSPYMSQTKFIELILLPEDKIKIHGALSTYYLDYTITGSAINEEYAKVREKYKEAAVEDCMINLEINSLQGIEHSKEYELRLFNKRKIAANKIYETKMGFVKANLDSDLSAYYLHRFDINLETFAEYYPQLSDDVRNGIFKSSLKDKYEEYLKYSATNKAELELTEGKPAPGFSLKDINGKTISLADFKGRFIVLDFWGTWCGPCMEEMPAIKAYHEKYKKKVAFVGIGCYDKETTWKTTVVENQLTWTQLINSDDNDVSVLYGVKSYPTKIIIDKELKIMKRFIGAVNEFYTTLDELIK